MSPFWWLPLPILQNTILVAVNQLFINSCLVIQNQRGTKTGQNHGKIKSRTLRPKYPLWNTSVSFAKVQICPLKNEGKSLFLSFTTHFPTIVPQMWLLQTVLTSNGLFCENWVLNFVLHSVGHFQKRDRNIIVLKPENLRLEMIGILKDMTKSYETGECLNGEE